MANKPTSKTVGVRLTPEAENFLLALSDKGSAGEGVRILVQEAMAAQNAPKSVEESQARLLEVLGDAPNVFHHPPRSVVAEDIVREALLILATVHMGPETPAPAVPTAAKGSIKGAGVFVGHIKGADIKNVVSESDLRKRFEADVVDRAFDLVDTLFRHSLSSQAAGWDSAVVRKRLMNSRDLLVATLAAVAKDNPTKSEG